MQGFYNISGINHWLEGFVSGCNFSNFSFAIVLPLLDEPSLLRDLCMHNLGDFL